MSAHEGTQRAADVGILAIEVYFPKLMVRQADLEEADGVSGKYTVGLGQQEMAVPSACEDVVSMALSACSQLLECHHINPTSIGRLEVGTECGMDRSKSVKSYLMQLFQEAGNTSIQGVDCVHGCYGATAALFNAAAWIHSPYWDGRLALVIASDIALYAPGSAARATGGCGAVALLLGPDAPLVLDPAWHTVHSCHSFDFHKPANSGPYPTVDGPASVHMYLSSLGACAQQLRGKLQGAASHRAAVQALAPAGPPENGLSNSAQQAGGSVCLLPQVDHFVAHAPFHAMVRKAAARLLLADALADSSAAALPLAGVELQVVWQQLQQGGAAGREGDRQLLEAAAPHITRLVADGCWLQQRLGNLYCGSLYCGLAALVERCGAQLEGRRVMMYSFGSGAMACLFALVGRRPSGGGGGCGFSLAGLQSRSSLGERLAARQCVDVAEYNRLAGVAADVLQGCWKGCVDSGCGGGEGCGWPGAWRLLAVDEQRRRHYGRSGKACDAC